MGLRWQGVDSGLSHAPNAKTGQVSTSAVEARYGINSGVIHCCGQRLSAVADTDVFAAHGRVCSPFQPEAIMYAKLACAACLALVLTGCTDYGGGSRDGAYYQPSRGPAGDYYYGRPPAKPGYYMPHFWPNRKPIW